MTFPDMPEGQPWWVYLLIVSIVCLTAIILGITSSTIKKVNDTLSDLSKQVEKHTSNFETVEAEHETLKCADQDVKNMISDVLVEIDRLKLSNWRAELFENPRSREHHEHLLTVGELYLKNGGNGSGRIRLDQLTKNYADRLEYDDWDYRPEVVNTAKNNPSEESKN